MRNKKLISMLMAGVMSLSLMACGTGSDSSSGQSNGQNDSGTVSETGENQQEITTVKLSYACLVVVPSQEGTQQVEDAINQYLEEKGEDVRIDLDPIDVTNYMTQIDMALVGGETIDVYCPLEGFDVAVNANKMLPLDDYLDNELAQTVEVVGEKMISPCVYNGKTYAIPRYSAAVSNQFWVCDKEIFDATGFKKEDIKSIYDLDPVLAKIHELNPDIAAIAPSLATHATGNNFNLMKILGGVEYDQVTDLGSGVCVVGDDRTVQNIYATDCFKEACEIAYRWNQNGYVVKDASVITDEPYDLMKAGRAASFMIGYGYAPESVEGIMVNQGGKETVAIPISTDVLSSTGLVWGISHTCKNPSAAAKVLNMLYTDEYVLNAIIFGLEGVSWEDAGLGDDPVKSIVYPAGLGLESVPYTAALSCGMMGNQFMMYALEGNTTAEDVTYMKNNMENAFYSPVFGFSVDVEDIKTQVSSVSNVTTQYEGGLCTGELDPDIYIPELLEELESAGINEIVASTQSQLDAWE